MNETLRTHVDRLFADAPDTPRIREFREELLGNLQAKYDDLLAAGEEPDAAVQRVISGIGDTASLIQILASDPEPDNPYIPRQQTAQVVSTAVFMYCAAAAVLTLVRGILGNTLAWVAFWLIVGVATAQLIFHFFSLAGAPAPARRLPPSYDEARRKRIRGSLSSILWLLTTALYFIISFTFGNWHISWIIFLIAPIVQQLLNLFFDMRG
ncbi:MAG: permease prefix domain 1-containing protein [Oscillospiraceae bacterium]|jgi:multisubunit Na+/H+ antiporter MnhG subunit|nr:permease prefix domain 1-containing protein [Oscillospiraceae bacterium]